MDDELKKLDISEQINKHDMPEASKKSLFALLKAVKVTRGQESPSDYCLSKDGNEVEVSWVNEYADVTLDINVEEKTLRFSVWPSDASVNAETLEIEISLKK
jgi:hypothetical protein